MIILYAMLLLYSLCETYGSRFVFVTFKEYSSAY